MLETTTIMLKPIAASFVTIVVIINVATFCIAANSTLPAVAVAWAAIIIIPSSAVVVLVAWIVLVAPGPVMTMVAPTATIVPAISHKLCNIKQQTAKQIFKTQQQLKLTLT